MSGCFVLQVTVLGELLSNKPFRLQEMVEFLAKVKSAINAMESF